MKRYYKKDKKNLLIALLLLFAVGVGIAYAILTQQLTIDSNVSYDSMKWNVGFTSATDGGGTISSVPIISTDKKSITVSCDVGTSTASETCITKATITNDSTFVVKLESDPTITFADTYISSVTAKWVDNATTVKTADTIDLGASREINITIQTKELTKDMLPSTATSVPITITMNWVEGTLKTYDWSNSTAVFVGDSITYGSSVSKKYHDVLKEQLNLASTVNLGINSSTISARSDYGSTKSPLIERYKSIPNADLIMIFMGTNDYGHETPLGTIEDTTDVSFYGALNVIIPALQELHPNSTIVIATPIHRYGVGTSGILGTSLTYDYLPNGVNATLGDYVTALKNIGQKYSVPVIDLYNLFPLDPTSESVRTQYMPDGLHPNQAGHEILASTIKKRLELIPKKSTESSGEFTYKDITIQVGNKYTKEQLTSPIRAAITQNVYMEAGTVIKLVDPSKYMLGVFTQTSETITSVSGNGNLLQAWTTTDYVVKNDGWIGIALKRVDEANFDLGGVDPNTLGAYITLKNGYEDITLQVGNKYTKANLSSTNRISVTKNIYMTAGTTIKIVDSNNYMFGVFTQTSETITSVSGNGNLLQAWTTTDYVVKNDGWIGIALKRADDSDFDLGGTEPTTLVEYIIIE